MQDHHRGGLFFLLLTIGGLLFPRDQSENPHACRIAGIGLAFVYLSGLQPVTVYQFALTLLGVLLLLSVQMPLFGTDTPLPTARPLQPKTPPENRL